MSAASEDDAAALHRATKRDDLEGISHLVEVRLVPVDIRNQSGETPLMTALKQYSALLPVIRYFLSNKADVNAITPNGKTPLMIASAYGNRETVEMLLKIGRADVNYVNPANGCTVLNEALAYGNGAWAVPMLLQYGANPNPTFVAEDHYYPLPLKDACQREEYGVIQELLEYGADVDAKDLDEGEAVMHVACKNIDTRMVRMLLAHGASLETVSDLGQTPLAVATWLCNIPILKVLLEHGAKVVSMFDQSTKVLYDGMTDSEETADILLDHCRRTMTEIEYRELLLQTDCEKNIPLHLVTRIEIAKLFVEQPRRDGKHLLSVCHAQLVSKNAKGLTPNSSIKANRFKQPSAVAYLETFESLPLSIAARKVTSTSSTPTKRRKLTDRLAVKLNPALNDFQRSVAEEALQVVMGATGLPDRVAYAILGCLSPLDMMKRRADDNGA